MIRVVGNPGCVKCKAVKMKLENRGISFVYEDIESLNLIAKTKLTEEAERAGMMSLPLIQDTETGKFMTENELFN